jgi:hypothetical protein
MLILLTQAWVASTPELANTCFPNPVEPLSDGTGVEPLVYADGEPCVTIEGEVNKVCVCMSDICALAHVCLHCSAVVLAQDVVITVVAVCAPTFELQRYFVSVYSELL